MSEPDEQRPPDPPERGPAHDGPERVYPPHEVQARLEVSASGLRRLAGIYERTVVPLPRDERGRVWPEDAVEALEDARAMVRESRAVSVEAALRGQEVGGEQDPYPATRKPSVDATGPGAAILEELRALRGLVEEQSRRISELEEAVRTGRELEAPEKQSAQNAQIESEDPPSVSDDVSEEAPAATVPGLGPPPAAPDVSGKIPTADEGSATVALPDEDTLQTERERGPWRRVLAWFGFGVRRP